MSKADKYWIAANCWLVGVMLAPELRTFVACLVMAGFAFLGSWTHQKQSCEHFEEGE